MRLRKGKILHVIDGLAIGGAERMLVNVANCACRHDWEVSVCVTRNDVSLKSTLNPEIQVAVLNRKSRFDLQGFWRLGRFIQKQRIDIIHAHGLFTFSFLAVARQLGFFHQPILLHDHTEKRNNEPVPSWFKLWGHTHLSFFVGVSKPIQNWALRAGIPSSRTILIPNGLDLNRLSCYPEKDIRKEFGLDSHFPVIVIVGGIRPIKGLDNLFKAIEVCPDLQEAQIVWIGEIKDKNYFHDITSRYAEFTNNFYCVGPREDAFSLMKKAELAVMPSHCESGPLVIIEYLLAGLPIAAFQTGEVSQIAAAAGVPGFIQPGDIEGLAYEIKNILNLPRGMRYKRGLLGQDFAQRTFDIEVLFQKWEKIYQTILSKN